MVRTPRSRPQPVHRYGSRCARLAPARRRSFPNRMRTRTPRRRMREEARGATSCTKCRAPIRSNSLTRSPKALDGAPARRLAIRMLLEPADRAFRVNDTDAFLRPALGRRRPRRATDTPRWHRPARGWQSTRRRRGTDRGCPRPAAAVKENHAGRFCLGRIVIGREVDLHLARLARGFFVSVFLAGGRFVRCIYGRGLLGKRQQQQQDQKQHSEEDGGAHGCSRIQQRLVGIADENRPSKFSIAADCRPHATGGRGVREPRHPAGQGQFLSVTVSHCQSLSVTESRRR